jgi:hypothetical protein
VLILRQMMIKRLMKEEGLAASLIMTHPLIFVRSE